MAYRHHKTKRAAKEYLKNVTPRSYGTPNRKIRKEVWERKDGWTSAVYIRKK